MLPHVATAVRAFVRENAAALSARTALPSDVIMRNVIYLANSAPEMLLRDPARFRERVEHYLDRSASDSAETFALTGAVDDHLEPVLEDSAQRSELYRRWSEATAQAAPLIEIERQMFNAAAPR